MNDVENVLSDKSRRLGLGSITLRIVIALNFVRFALSFLPWFPIRFSLAYRLIGICHLRDVCLCSRRFSREDSANECLSRICVATGVLFFRIQESRHRRPRFRLTILDCI
jgi:hypothetical protein